MLPQARSGHEHMPATANRPCCYSVGSWILASVAPWILANVAPWIIMPKRSLDHDYLHLYGAAAVPDTYLGHAAAMPSKGAEFKRHLPDMNVDANQPWHLCLECAAGNEAAD